MEGPERPRSAPREQEAAAELREQLRAARERCGLAAGAISSLHRQLEAQRSRLRAAESEKQALQKRLGEREEQLRAMSSKFCSLREEWKHEEMLAALERENCSLRQVVTEQESKLAEQKELIRELEGTVSQLRAEVLAGQRDARKQRQAHEETQRHAESLEHRELQTRVALECVTSRFERYRSKIIQATFSAAGSKPPQAELTDEEVLEAMQKIINERMEFYQLLKQSGKVPSFHSIDPPLPLPTGTKGSRRSSAAKHLNS